MHDIFLQGLTLVNVFGTQRESDSAEGLLIFELKQSTLRSALPQISNLTFLQHHNCLNSLELFLFSCFSVISPSRCLDSSTFECAVV